MFPFLPKIIIAFVVQKNIRNSISGLEHWVVTNPDGSPAGTNTIVKLQENCLLQENWASANGKVTGTSNNFYNYKADQWEQIWVDNMGGKFTFKRKSCRESNDFENR